MPIGPFGEILGTTGTLEGLAESAQNYKSKVIAPRNPKLVKGEQPEFKMKPSQFLFQMSMDTEKKLANMHTMNVPRKVELLDMADTTHQKVSTVSIDEPMFQPFPSEIFYQNFEPFETYEVPLILRNNDKVPRLVKVTMEESPYFKVISPHNVGHKVGPGLPTTFKLQFTPEEKKDYDHELVCITEREKFIVPVKAIGARAILDFPDDVFFQACPVKYPSTKTLLVRNIGNQEAKFSLSTESPFTVSPPNGVLPVNESMQVVVTFEPQWTGDHCADLVVHYDTGENIYVNLHGVAQDALVRLDKNSLRIENTFISMANQRTVTISNRSDVIAHFRWTRFATQEEEDQQKNMFCGNLSQELRLEKDRFLEECITDPSIRDKMSVLSRTFQNRRRIIEDDKMLFTDDVFRIEPAEGDIWPNSALDVYIIFKPDEAKTYQRTAFCDVTGRQSRLPLRLKGMGTGPRVQFSFDQMDMGNIFVNSTHTYEVVIANKGDIDAIFSLVPATSVFGTKFTFNPSEGIVMPDGHQAVQVTFRSPVLGDFREDFHFQIDGSPDKVKLTFKGSVIGPTFQFDVPKLKFGTVSYGFVNTATCRLQNTALVPMTFSLRVPGDGLGESICSTSEYGSTMSEAGSSMPPKEFEITPSSGTILPQSEIKIQVDLCSNTIKKYELSLVVDVEGVGDEVLSLPISAKCVVPSVSVLTPILDYGRCFLRHPYEHNVKLQNDTDLPAKYELMGQHLDELTSVLYTSPKPRGVVLPNSVLDVPLVITPQGLEELDVIVQMVIFGSPDPPLSIHVTCIGEGPVVHITPMDLNWGQIPVLTDVSKVVHLSNESLIPAKFTVNMVRPNSVWRVEPSSGEIGPEEQLNLTVTACLDDCVRFQDKIQINVMDGPSGFVPVMAYGQGTTIVTDPPMVPALHLGPHFSKGPCRRRFTLTNRGRRHQALVWSTEGFSFLQKAKPRHGELRPINPKDMKYKDMPPPPAPPQPVFRLTPHRMELNPGESIDILLEGTLDEPKPVHERLQCHAIIGRAGGKELIMKVAVNCEFITPLLEFSSHSVAFRIDKQPDEELSVQTQELEVTNVSSLPVTACFSLKYPFTLLMAQGQEVSSADVTLGIGQRQLLRIQFDPAYRSDSHIRTIDEQLTVTYSEHPHTDTINLRGEVYFPNLEFEKRVVDFGCILNDTEVTRYINITNNSPMDVQYRWSFLVDGGPVAVVHSPPAGMGDDDEEEEAVRQQAGSGGEQAHHPMVVVNVEGSGSPRVSEEGPRQMEQVDKDALILSEDDDGEEKKDAEKNLEEEEHQEEDGEELEEEGDMPNSPHVVGSEMPLDIAEDRNLADHLSLDSPVMSARGGGGGGPPLSSRPLVNPNLTALLAADRGTTTPIGVEEIFDILPLYGTLKPGDTEQITFTFFGHADMASNARALCEVVGGPAYDVKLAGDASLVHYRFDCLEIDYGKQMFDQIASAEIVLMNTGRVGFDFMAFGMDPGMASRPKPGVPVMIPHTGFIEANSQQTLTIKFLPGVPERFHRSFQIQVAHFEPDTVHLYGEGVFPRISLDLPRLHDPEGHYERLAQNARQTLLSEGQARPQRPGSAVSQQGEAHVDLAIRGGEPSELEIQMEVERLVVKEFAEAQHELANRPDILEVHTTSQPASTQESKGKPRRKQKPRPRLPDYLLDFGHVVLGTVRTHIVRATNTGWFPASFAVDREHLHAHGFNAELDRVRQLPGAPDHETIDFVVSFDPRGANLGLGEVETIVPINISGGPQVCLYVKANVTMPDMQISTDVLDFGDVKCGECKVITVQLHNHKHVRCEWNSLPTDKDRLKIDRHVPMHLRRKQRQERQKPRTFEMMPPTGTLLPGQRQNVQVKFMPNEQQGYEQRLVVRLSQSSQRLVVLCRGQGQEPRLEFDRNLVEFGPILPHSGGDEQDVVVRNPCDFAVEFYNLEFDKAFLEEEKILRLMKGYDEYNTILLPPRNSNEKLPQELLDYYDEQMKKFEEAERARREAEESAEALRREAEEREAEAAAAAAAAMEEEGEETAAKEGSEDAVTIKVDGGATSGSRNDTTEGAPAPSVPSQEKGTSKDDKEDSDDKEDKEDKLKDSSSALGVGELEITPVSAAIARHLGIDLSPEGKAARNRRGIAIIVHGAPMSGKTSSAVTLAKHYNAALLTVDGIILEAISNGNTPAGLRARELCAEAARRRAEERQADGGEDGGKGAAAAAAAAAGLSVEAVTAHTAGQGGLAMATSVAHSMVSNRKTSTISDQKSKTDKHHGSNVGGKTAAGTSSGEAGSLIPGSPQPLAAPIARRLSVSASVAGEEGLLSCILPIDLLVELLSERLLLNDCMHGVIIDGLETLFSQNQYTTAHAVLKAFNNRRYIYFVTLKLDYNVLKEQEKKAQEEKERQMQEQEEAQRRHLEEMSEDEYDALDDETKAEVDRKRLDIKKERLRREMEEKRLERERREREAQEAEQRRQDEEKRLLEAQALLDSAKRKKRRGGPPDPKDGKKSQAAGKASDVKVQDRVGQLKSQEGKKDGGDPDKRAGSDRPESHATERGESAAEDRKKKAEKGSKEGKRPISNEAKGEKGDREKGEKEKCDKDKGEKEKGECTAEEAVKDPVKEADLLLMQRFRTFEHGLRDINELIGRWERSAGLLRPVTPSDGAADAVDEQANLHPPSGKKGKKGAQDKKDTGKAKDAAKEEKAVAEKAAKETKEAVESVEGVEAASGAEPAPLTEEERREKRLEDGIGIPNIVMDCSDPVKPVATRILQTGKLPTIDEIMDGLGLGPHGPPIPPPATFSVVCYPIKRHAPPGAEGGHYLFVASSPDDPNIAVEEKAPEPEVAEEQLTTPEVGRKEEYQTPTKGGKGGKDKLSDGKGGKDAKGRKSSAKSRIGRRGSINVSSPPPGVTTPASETEGSTAAEMDSKAPKERDQSAGPRDDRLGTFRWVVPPRGEVVLRLRFSSEDLGQFDQTLNFEIVGTRRRYQLYCRGICAFPTISREPRIVFPHRKKSKKADEIVHRKYILTSEIFEFGPLMVGTQREKYKEGRSTENMEKLTILNTSPLEADVSFCFLNDSRAETYLLEPPTMLLKPGQSEELIIWAYPKVPGTYEDSLICCVKENPEPIIFKLLCYGVRPELELDKKIIHFDKVLLHRKDTKKLYLRNSTMLPVAWSLSGLELLGDDFSVSQESGVIEPKSEFALHAYFRAMKAVTTTKKSIKLQVTDKDNIYGLVQVETIQVHAEAYDVALDMTFPKGVDGGIDFDVIRVLDEQKHQVSLKNKGKYEIGYAFMFEPTDGCPEEVCKMFSVTPARGTISPVDRPAQVSVTFRSNCEVTVKDQPILRCQVIEPNMPDGGETIASIPIKISVRSVFSKYKVLPVSDINFGALMVSSKKTRTFTIENRGDRFEFKYTITKMVNESTQQATRGRGPLRNDRRSRSRDGSSSGRSVARPRRAESISEEKTPSPQPTKAEADKSKKKARQEVGGANQSRLVLGMFTIFPAFGYILPGGHQTITIDCVAENAGRCEEDIAIDITGRDPTDNPTGIPYRLFAEACVPAINVADVGAIFEEHRIVQNLTLHQQGAPTETGGVYGEDENRFVFNNVLVGVKAKARFKISNTNKVPCDVLFTVRAAQTKHSSKQPDVFEVDPPRAQVPSHSHIYATVSFQPRSMQQYNAMFEAALDGVPPNQAKGRNLTFEVAGEGNLPRINVFKPSVRNKKGQPLLLFKKILVGAEQIMPLIISNDGTLPCKVDLDMVDPDSAFSLRPVDGTQAIMADDDGRRRPHTASVIVEVGKRAVFSAVFRPSLAQRSQAQIKLSVVDNQYEDAVVVLVGEGYVDDITLEKISSVMAPNSGVEPESEEGSMADDDVAAAKCNHLRFGDIFIQEARTLSFTMVNHSTTDAVRFLWPADHPQLRFSPTVGHLHAARSKDVAVTFKAEAPKTLVEEAVQCRLTKITLEKTDAGAADWDDRLRSVKWVDVAPTPMATTEGSSSKGPGATPVPVVVGRPSKKKVVETETEPAYSEVADSSRALTLLASANADFCKYRCKTDSVRFKDTLMFQTRVYEFEIQNKGVVALDYNWQVVMDTFQGPRSVTFADSPRGGAGGGRERPSTASAFAVRPGSATGPAAAPDGGGGGGGRPGSSMSSVITDVNYVPFSIEPETGMVQGGKRQSFKVKFSPLDMQEYEARLICSIPNLEEGKQGPVVAVRGRSLMPYCHFELEDSNYLSAARRDPELRGPAGAPPGTTLDPNTRVIEFTNVGVGVRNVRNFFLVNPTSQRYSFHWQNEDDPNPKTPANNFTCLMAEGEVGSGKKAEVGFEFASSSVGLSESFWRFVIPEHNLSVPFLLVGHSMDPNITMDRSHLNFKSLLIGHEALEVIYLVNNEAQPFSFAFDEASCHSAGYEASLRVEPITGTIEAKARIPVKIYFTPNSQKEVNFNLVCNVKKKTKPLSLNVKAEGYSMNCLVLCEDSDGNKVEFNNNCINEINFDKVEVNERAIRNIYIINAGKFNFDYSWELVERSGPRQEGTTVSINPPRGGVMFGEKQRCQLAFCPTTTTSLRGCELKLKISNGPTYNMKVTGHGMLPGIHFSFKSHNFGPCFIHRAGMPTHTVVLKVTNKDRKEISVDCLYQPTAHLKHEFEAQVIKPGEKVDVPFTFYPRDPVKYNEEVTFEINGLSRQVVNFTGLGTQMKVEVADPRHKLVKLGALRVGQKLKRVIPIVNNSPADIRFSLAITPSKPVLQDSSVLRVSPLGEIHLEPKTGSAKVTVEFTPTTRIPQFTEEVLLECAGLSQPLFVIQGCCQGIDIQLDTDAVPFGAVVQKSSSARKLAMFNVGDIGARFRWDVESFAPDFTISPTQGYLSPGMEVTLEVTFHPQEVNQDIRYEGLKCFIEGAKPLRLTLTGMCTVVPPVRDVLNFTAHVRQRESRNLMVANRTNMHWDLRPVIDGEYFSGAETFQVEPQQTKGYELIYKPLTMTTEGRKHTGTVFFPLPDGTGLMYNVSGVAEAPKPTGKIKRDVPCKTTYTEMLTVSNWLKKPQRFRVKIEIVRPEKLDPGTMVKGLDYIDVPSNSKRDYKLTFYAHKEGVSQLKVVFTNEATGEFQFYEVTFTGTKPGTVSTIHLITPVRQSVPHTIKLQNPLTYAVTFGVSCVPQHELLMPGQFTVPANSEGAFNFEYLPLKVGETQGHLDFMCNDLGLYVYDLSLKATPAGPEKGLHFRTGLGTSAMQLARFINYAKQKTDYSCKVDNNDFHVDKNVAAAPGSNAGTEVAVEVHFEPSRIGESRGTLTVSSAMGGDYVFPLFGTCVPPRPQGPFVVRAGGTTSITFRNVFSSPMLFTFQVDNPLFHVAKSSETIRSHKDHRIVVGFDGGDSSVRAAVMGKLVVSCARSAGGATNAQWVYYLRGETPDSR